MRTWFPSNRVYNSNRPLFSNRTQRRALSATIPAFSQLGNEPELFLKKGEYQKALETSNQLIEEGNRSWKSYETKAISLSSLGRNEEAKDVLDKRLKESQNSDDKRIIQSMLNGLQRQENFEKLYKKKVQEIGNNSFEVKFLGAKGRGAIASTDIEEGQVIFTDTPLLGAMRLTLHPIFTGKDREPVPRGEKH
jgi:tetratricopeptide (TPR) repeat protein